MLCAPCDSLDGGGNIDNGDKTGGDCPQHGVNRLHPINS